MSAAASAKVAGETVAEVLEGLVPEAGSSTISSAASTGASSGTLLLPSWNSLVTTGGLLLATHLFSDMLTAMHLNLIRSLTPSLQATVRSSLLRATRALKHDPSATPLVQAHFEGLVDLGRSLIQLASALAILWCPWGPLSHHLRLVTPVINTPPLDIPAGDLPLLPRFGLQVKHPPIHIPAVHVPSVVLEGWRLAATAFVLLAMVVVRAITPVSVGPGPGDNTVGYLEKVLTGSTSPQTLFEVSYRNLRPWLLWQYESEVEGKRDQPVTSRGGGVLLALAYLAMFLQWGLVSAGYVATSIWLWGGLRDGRWKLAEWVLGQGAVYAAYTAITEGMRSVRRIKAASAEGERPALLVVVGKEQSGEVVFSSTNCERKGHTQPSTLYEYLLQA